MERIKLVVIEEHTLGYMINENYAGVLRASVLKGSPILGSPLSAMDNVLVKGKKVRLASEQDFDSFNVSFKGYDNKQNYEYKE